MSELSTLSVLCWFRRDLRLHDHAALYHALKRHARVHCVFVFDTDILDHLQDRRDRRVTFIWESVRALHAELAQHGATLHVLHGRAAEQIPALAERLAVAAVYCNRDYEPAARARDAQVAAQLAAQGRSLHSFKDQVIFEQDEILTGSRTPFAVFTPYKNAWLKALDEFQLRAYPVQRYLVHLAHEPVAPLPAIEMLGFQAAALMIPSGSAGAAQLFADFQTRMADYQTARDYPAVKGVSYLSTHLRFGTVSIRALAAAAWHAGGKGAQAWLSELIWRDFYHMVLYHHPQVVGHAYKPQFDALEWVDDAEGFAAWCAGRTGYPLVDAAMRQLEQSGYMHNRLRMVTASFLTKDLRIDWRKGEAWFAGKLLDFDLAANNGGWQWAASTGCDGQPWFRIFNPVTQSERFDPQGRFIRRYVPELAQCPERYLHAPWLIPAAAQQASGFVPGRDYPLPIVDHAVARVRTLEMFKRCAR
jgi:deoxyribodipyrimidine photo-lyase